MQRVMVTGANGFVASVLSPLLLEKGFAVRGVTRTIHQEIADNYVIGEINSKSDWSAALENVDAVVHLAARVHVMNEKSEDPLAAFRKVNLEGTRRLAEQAAAAGVKRFIFISSIKVNGEQTDDLPFRAKDKAAPEDAYGVSKLEAERALQSICEKSGMEWVVIRPPLVYGPGVKGNFARLAKLVAKGVPLPFKAGSNKRSMVSVYNLSELIIQCIISPAAANTLFLVSDHQDVTIQQLLQKMAQAMCIPSRLFYLPPKLLYTIFTMLGRKNEIKRLLGSLEVDITETCEVLGWEPPLSLEQGLQRSMESWKR